ncbi:MAG: hypothetical protein II200_05240 [Bacteroidaceae bacterium]|nr:hypothetical protein [Bacteroidaceae bacterium]
MKSVLLAVATLIAGVAMAQQQSNSDMVAYADDASTQSLETLVANVEKALSEGITYVAVGVEPEGEFENHGYVRLDYNEETYESTINVTCNAPEISEGAIEYLADNNHDTYFHSNWSSYATSEVPHNLIVDLGEGNALSAIAVKTLKRNTSTYNSNRAPTKWNVYGSNDDSADKQWSFETTLFLDYIYDYSKIEDYDGYQYQYNVPGGVGFGCAGLSQAYRYLRFDAVDNLNGEPNYFFALSEFGVWEAKLDYDSSIDSTIPAEVKAYLLAELQNAKIALSEGAATKAQVIALQTAFDAYLNAEYAPNLSQSNLLFTEDAEVVPGATFMLPILMNNAEQLTAFQFDLYLPNGVTLAMPESAATPAVVIEQTVRLSAEHVVEAAFVSDGALRIVGYSMENTPIEGSEGALLYVPLVMSADAATDYHTIAVSNVRLSTVENQVYKPEGVTSRLLTIPGEAPSETDPENYANVLYAEDITVSAGEEFALPILMRNTEDIISFQLDLVLPEGITFKVDEDDYPYYELNSDRIGRGFSFETNFLAPNVLRFVCYSMRNNVIPGTEGEVFNVTLVPADDLADGDYELSVKNIVMTKTDAMTAFEVEHVKSVVTVASALLGDVNGDGQLNVSDVSSIVALLLNPEAGSFNKAADVNCDGQLNVSDVSSIVNLLLTGN